MAVLVPCNIVDALRGLHPDGQPAFRGIVPHIIMQVTHVGGFGLRRDEALFHLLFRPTGHAAVWIQVEVGPRRLQLLVDGLDGLAALAALVDDLGKLLFHNAYPFHFFG